MRASKTKLKAKPAAPTGPLILPWTGIHGFLPSREMCTDNAAMIAAAGWHRLRSDGPTSLDAGAYPNMRLQFVS